MARFQLRRRTRHIAAILACLLLSSAAYNHVMEARERARYPQVGRSVDIGGRSLNLYCSGEAAPTVVFDTFSHQAGLNWISAQARTLHAAQVPGPYVLVGAHDAVSNIRLYYKLYPNDVAAS